LPERAHPPREGVAIHGSHRARERVTLGGPACEKFSIALLEVLGELLDDLCFTRR
jgi:hypothetical protein